MDYQAILLYARYRETMREPNTYIRVLFGHRLREIRTKQGTTQESLAEAAGLDRTYVSKIERGERNVSLDIVARLAAALGSPIFEFFKSPDNDKNGSL